MKRLFMMIFVLLLTMVWFTGCSSASETAAIEQNVTAKGEIVVESDTNIPSELTVSSETIAQAVVTEPSNESKPTETTTTTVATTTTKTTVTNATSSRVSTQTTSTKTTPNVSEKISLKDAKQIALKRADVTEKEISRYEIKLDYDDDTRRWEYEIGFYVDSTEYDVELDAETGKVLRYEVERKRVTAVSTKTPTTSRSTASTTIKTSGQISREEAKRIALNRFGVAEKEISRYEIKLDYDDDARRWEYEIGFYVGSTEYDVELDAETGNVLRAEKEAERKPVSTTKSTDASKVTVSKTKAKTIALERAGVTEQDISRYEIELDFDDDFRRWEYEISFNVGRVEYDVRVDATTGVVLEYEKEVD